MFGRDESRGQRPYKLVVIEFSFAIAKRINLKGFSNKSTLGTGSLRSFRKLKIGYSYGNGIRKDLHYAYVFILQQ